MKDSGYWHQITKSRFARRRLLVTAGGSLTAAALLAACGKSNSSESQQGSGILAKPVDTTKQAKSGGTYKSLVTQDAQTLGPYYRSAPAVPHTTKAYQRLFVLKPGYLAPQSDEYEGDMVESWEFSGDKSTLTLKLRQGGKWDNRAPTSGRPIEANDVVASWQRFSQISSIRTDYANSVNPDAPIVSMAAPDARTVVINLHKTPASLLAQFSTTANSGFWILPKEADGGFDSQKEQRGSGPYTLTEYVPSSRFVYEKNPNYYNRDKVLMQRIEHPIITEYATALAQFKTGNVFTLTTSTPVMRPEDILPTKKDTPDLNVYKSDITSRNYRYFFGFQEGPKSPFRDVRLRQAFSMSLDRDLYIDAFYNVAAFKSAGIDVDTAWSTAIPAGLPGWWLDPKGKDFGENAKYFKHDIAEAKKLVAAAGFADGLDVDAHHITTNDYGSDFPPKVQAIIGMVRDSGLRLRSVPANFATDWQQKYRDVKGNFDGVAFVLNNTSGDTGDVMYGLYNASGSQFSGFDPQGQGTFKGDPVLDDLTARMKVEFDVQKRYALAHELQKYDAKTQYYTLFDGGANGFDLVWPAVENWAVYKGGIFLEYYLWVNDQKLPLKKA